MSKSLKKMKTYVFLFAISISMLVIKSQITLGVRISTDDGVTFYYTDNQDGTINLTGCELPSKFSGALIIHDDLVYEKSIKVIKKDTFKRCFSTLQALLVPSGVILEDELKEVLTPSGSVTLKDEYLQDEHFDVYGYNCKINVIINKWGQCQIRKETLKSSEHM